MTVFLKLFSHKHDACVMLAFFGLYINVGPIFFYLGISRDETVSAKDLL